MIEFKIGQEVWVRKHLLVAAVLEVGQTVLRLSYGHKNEMKTWFDTCDIMPIEHLLMDFIEIQRLHETHKEKDKILT